jgi:ATP-dependent protease ClpP protease subunit
MKEVRIRGVIGYDWWKEEYTTAAIVEEQLQGLKDGEEVSVTINSPGGSVYEGVAIFNLLREAAKKCTMSVRVTGVALSMASYIAMVARTVNRNARLTVSDNSVIMIHNPWTVGSGDYREFFKEAEYLEKLAALYARVHSVAAGKPVEEIRAAMDKETFYVGKEIQDVGFANVFDAMTPTSESGAENALGREDIALNARVRWDKISAKAREFGGKTDFLSVATLLNDENILAGIEGKHTESPGHGDNSFQKNDGGLKEMMRPEELLAQDKECYEAIFALGESAGLERERERVLAHVRRGKKIGAMEVAVKHIESGKSVSDEEVSDEYLDAALVAQQRTDRLADDPPPLRTGNGDVDDRRLEAAFDLGLRGKDARGKSWE